MIVRKSHHLQIPGHRFTRVDDILVKTLHNYAHSSPYAFNKPTFSFGWYGSVRSIQRMPLPQKRSAQWLADRYITWLAAYLPWAIKASRKNGRVKLCIPGLDLILLSFSYSPVRSSKDRILYYIDGGLLASTKNRKGRLEFRKIPPGQELGLVAIHDFIPALPWFIYRYSQAKIHAFIIQAFKRYLEGYGRAKRRRLRRFNKVKCS